MDIRGGPENVFYVVQFAGSFATLLAAINSSLVGGIWFKRSALLELLLHYGRVVLVARSAIPYLVVFFGSEVELEAGAGEVHFRRVSAPLLRVRVQGLLNRRGAARVDFLGREFEQG